MLSLKALYKFPAVLLGNSVQILSVETNYILVRGLVVNADQVIMALDKFTKFPNCILVKLLLFKTFSSQDIPSPFSSRSASEYPFLYFYLLLLFHHLCLSASICWKATGGSFYI